MIITLTLNAAVDKAYHINGTVEPGTVMRVHTCRNTAGGKGLNVARVIKLCREDVMPSGLAGGSTGASGTACQPGRLKQPVCPCGCRDAMLHQYSG